MSPPEHKTATTTRSAGCQPAVSQAVSLRLVWSRFSLNHSRPRFHFAPPRGRGPRMCIAQGEARRLRRPKAHNREAVEVHFFAPGKNITFDFRIGVIQPLSRLVLRCNALSPGFTRSYAHLCPSEWPIEPTQYEACATKKSIARWCCSMIRSIKAVNGKNFTC